MTSATIIHRYRFSAAEVVDALGLSQDCANWTITIDAGGVVVDIVEPGQAPSEPPPSEPGCRCQGCERVFRADLLVPDEDWAKISPKDVEGDKGGGLLCASCIMERLVDRAGWTAGRAVDVEGVKQVDAPSTEPTEAEIAPEPELKGGPLAQRAAICCGEPGFRTFLGVKTADEAKADLCRRCGITSRKTLDHDEAAAAIWRDIDGKYRLWLEGHDVELD